MADEKKNLLSKDFVDSDGEVKQRKKRKRKTIGEEGSRKQTAIGLIITLGLSLMFYLPTEFKNWWRKFNQVEMITIEKPIGDSEDISSVVGFEIVIKKKKDVEDVIDRLLNGLDGDYGIWVENLKTSEGFSINGSKVFQVASLNKIPILIEYYRQVDSGKIDPEEVYILEEEDRWEYGTGIIQNQPAGTEYSYEEVAELTANQSDNMGVKLLGGWVNKELVKEMTVEKMGNIFRDLYNEKLISKESRDKLFLSLTNTVNEERITAGVPSKVRVVHKFGSEEGVVNDCGIVYASEPYVICLMSSQVNSGEAEEVLPKISRVVWEWVSK
ncbi:MAG: serine hydrolase [Patescibacteria group bacterium]|nr:serine hydrolase [Patescibacteria group bacterium]